MATTMGLTSVTQRPSSRTPVVLWKWMPLDLALLNHNHGMSWNGITLDMLLDDSQPLLPLGLGWTQLLLPWPWISLILPLMDDNRLNSRMLPFRGRATLDCGMTSFLPMRGFRGLCPHQPAPRSCEQPRRRKTVLLKTSRPRPHSRASSTALEGQSYPPKPAALCSPEVVVVFPSCHGGV